MSWFLLYYEGRYDQHMWARLAAMRPVIHHHAHVSMAFKNGGPRWVYWQYPMEGMCGILTSKVRSRVQANRNLANIILIQEQKNPLLFTLPKADQCGNEGNTKRGSVIGLGARADEENSTLFKIYLSIISNQNGEAERQQVYPAEQATINESDNWTSDEEVVPQYHNTLGCIHLKGVARVHRLNSKEKRLLRHYINKYYINDEFNTPIPETVRRRYAADFPPTE